MYLEYSIAVAIGFILGYVFLHFGKIQFKNKEISTLRQQIMDEAERIEELRSEKNLVSKQLAQLEIQLLHAEEKLRNQKEELIKMDALMTQKFEQIASKVVRGNSQDLQEQHSTQLKHILEPLKERIVSFEQKVSDNQIFQAKEHQSLKEQILDLKKLNDDLSKDAQNLAAAFKGDKKMQGDWGENQLERILQYAGLSKGIHYSSQSSFKNDEGENFRPDLIIYLPDEKHLIIDSKVSIVAYEAFFNSDDKEIQKKKMAEHVQNIKNHIKSLSGKSYSDLQGLNSPDYVLMYIPVEAALNVALSQDSSLFENALQNNIVLVSNSTLLATLKTISYIWQQDNLSKNYLEIAEEGGKLYDKFVTFTETIDSIEKRFSAVAKEFGKAKNQLSEGPGNLVNRVKKLKKLGAKAKKELNRGADYPEDHQKITGGEDGVL
jgi:DNA recombination protein RmuC